MMTLAEKISLSDGPHFARLILGRGTMAIGRYIINDAGTSPYEMTAAGALTIVSASTADASGGTGARTVLVTGLDTNWNIVSDIVTMNGTTPVSLPSVVLHPYLIEVLTTGSGNYNAGVITVKDGSSNTILTLGDSKTNQSRASFMPVPAGYKCIVGGVSGSSDGTVAVKVLPEYKPYGCSWLTGFGIDLTTTTSQVNTPFAIKAIPEKTLIRVVSIVASGTPLVQGGLDCLFIKMNQLPNLGL